MYLEDQKMLFNLMYSYNSIILKYSDTERYHTPGIYL